jgi:hypothetical protein
MFRKQMILASTFFLPIAAFWLFQTTWMRESDLARYQELIRQKEIASSASQEATKQHRKRVQKDIWFSQNESPRLHCKIFSEGSLLTLTPVGNHFEIVESFEGIRCWMQDKLVTDDKSFELTQQARLIEASSAIYRHTSKEFSANDVHLSLFELPGHTLPNGLLPTNQAYLNGVARDVSFHFVGETPQLNASHFEAKVVEK